MNPIRIRGAKLHNLKSIDLDIPKGQFVVITGVSGSGKSTLAFDLVYREGKRRYNRAVGHEAHVDESGFDSITGLVPTVAVEQRIIRQSNPRSLVGTRTRILGLMQLMYSLAGSYICSCGGVTNSRRICQDCDQTIEPLPAAYFNFNSPLGMCLTCFGTGRVSTVSEEQVLLRKEGKSILRGTPGKLKDGLKRLAKAYDFELQDQLSSLSDKSRNAYMHGDLSVGYEGLLPFLNRMNTGKEGVHSRICPSCEGSRLGPDARNITIGGLNISVLGGKTLREQARFWEGVSREIIAADPNLKGVLTRMTVQIHLLCDVGLSHLSLFRKTPTLSGGELQRLFLAFHLESDLEGLIYIFDEPTVGLHEMEKARLIQRLRDLQNKGNSVIVVEHDPGVIHAADWIIEIGPGAGTGGGHIVYEGNLEGYLASSASRIVPFLPTDKHMLTEKSQESRYAPVTCSTPRLTVRKASTHNLKNITVSFPLGVMVGVAGASGSGKSSLVSSTLVPLLAGAFGDVIAEGDHETDSAGEIDDESDQPGEAVLEGAEFMTGVSFVTQAPIGRTKTSTPASYIGIWDRIRSLFAAQNRAKERGLLPGDFSFNSTGGCPECGGEGTIKKEARGFSFTWECHVCRGTRYRPDVLEITVDGKTIADILEMTVQEAAAFFQNDHAISGNLLILEQVGMGYLRLGQSATTISGGEAQRIKLAKELGRSRSGGRLYILDEPTTGLSCADTGPLMNLLRSLVERGNTVVIIEHDLSVLSQCDWLIELGPGGGDEGGEVIAQGSPSSLQALPGSIIGSYWRRRCE